MGTLFGGNGMRPLTLLALAIGILALPTFASASDQKYELNLCEGLRDKIELHANWALGHDGHIQKLKKKFAEASSKWRKTGVKDQTLMDDIEREINDWKRFRDGSLTEANKFAPIYQALCKD
jgi:hypothetical protein